MVGFFLKIKVGSTIASLTTIGESRIPKLTLNPTGLPGEVLYGGRVTDDLDKHLLNTFTRVWFSETTFSDKFCFYKGYSIPGLAKTVQDFQAHIETMPVADTPEVSVYPPSGTG